jgi:hypothetical protein
MHNETKELQETKTETKTEIEPSYDNLKDGPFWIDITQEYNATKQISPQVLKHIPKHSHKKLVLLMKLDDRFVDYNDQFVIIGMIEYQNQNQYMAFLEYSLHNEEDGEPIYIHHTRSLSKPSNPGARLDNKNKTHRFKTCMQYQIMLSYESARQWLMDVTDKEIIEKRDLWSILEPDVDDPYAYERFLLNQLPGPNEYRYDTPCYDD